MLQYLLNVTAIWLISLVLFEALLKKENYHGYNRFYLVFTFFLGMLLPLQQLSSASWHDLDLLSGGMLQWILLAYAAGAAVMFCLLIVDIIKLVVFYRRGSKSKEDGWVVIETGKEHPPFSYLDILFVSGRAHYEQEEWEMILNHEQRHSVLLHLVDMLLMQLARVVLWFHPLVYVYHRRLLLVHEYQADHGSSKQAEQYGKFLIEQAVLKAAPAFSHSFNRSPIKNRILMLARNTKPRTGLSNLKLLTIVPLTLACVLFCSKSSFSTVPPGEVWKKQVTRIIDLYEPEDTVRRHLNKPEADSTLLEVMVSSIDAGKTTAYSAFDTRFSERITREKIKEIMFAKPDTTVVVDPITGNEIVQVIPHDFDYSTATKFRVLEEWTFNQRTQKTEIEIIGIAPIQDVYVNGLYRGKKPLFWVRYRDIQSLLARYELYHPHKTLASQIWEDNFRTGPEKQP